MENSEPHKREIFWYNISVPHERGDLIFDIGSQTLHRPTLQWLEDLWAGAFVHRPKPRQRGFGKTAANGVDGDTSPSSDGRARSPSAPFRGAAETHPTPAACTQQRIGASEKTTTFTDEAEYGVAPHGYHAAQPLFLCFVQARSGASRKQGFEGAPLFFSAPKRHHSVK